MVGNKEYDQDYTTSTFANAECLSQEGTASLPAVSLFGQCVEDPKAPYREGDFVGEGALCTVEGDEGVSSDGEDYALYRWTWNGSSWAFVDFNVTHSELRGIFPSGAVDSLILLEEQINLQGSKFGIDSKESLAHFLSQAGHEVSGFTGGLGVSENLNYSVDRLVEIFPKYFYKGTPVAGKYDADDYGRKSGQAADKEGIANITYSNRMGNGDKDSGDGYKYRGRGIFQLTGKNNYRDFNDFINIDGKNFVENPDLILEPQYAILSALWYFKSRVVDVVENIGTASVKEVTKLINGGTNGLDDREDWHEKATEELIE